VNNGFKATLLGISALFATQTFAEPLEQAFVTGKYTLQAGIVKDFLFLPGKPQVIVNPLVVPLIADCTVLNIGDQEEVTLAATVLENMGIVNGITFTTHEFVRMPIQVNETFQIIAYPSARVSILNEGEYNVTSRCTVRLKN
jgi:hypothetical protein